MPNINLLRFFHTSLIFLFCIGTFWIETLLPTVKCETKHNITSTTAGTNNKSSQIVTVALPKDIDLQVQILSDVSIPELVDKIEIKSAAGTLPEVSHFILENPARLVIDFAFRPPSIKRDLKLEHSKNISGIRIGSHIDKLRIVLDTNLSQFPASDIENTQNILRIRFNRPDRAQVAANQLSSEDLATEKLPTEESQISLESGTGNSIKTANPKQDLSKSKLPQVKSVAALRIGTSINSNNISEKFRETENTELPLRLESETTVDQPPKVEGVLFEAISFLGASSEKPALISFKFSAQPRFRLTRKGEGTYALEVNAASITSEQLALPYFPPQDLEGITFVSAKQVKDKTTITIGTERGTRLEIDSQDKEIFVWPKKS